MPGFPHFAERADNIPASVFEKFRDKMKKQGPFLIRLHIGDTYLPPDYHLPVEDSFLKERPYFNRYCNTFGVERFRGAAVQKLREDNGFNISTRNILAISGATNGLSASVLSLLNPGDEILVLTPCWPFFPGMVKLAGATGVEVPFYTRLYAQADLNIEACLQPFLTEKTAAVYLNTPNNPSGKVLNRSQLEQIARFARANRLWIISDEAYDGLTFDGRPHISIATLPGMFEQTISIFTFSKSFMFAGLRLGYLAAAEETVKMINKVMVHQLYSPSTFSQYMMVEPLQQREQWIPGLQKHYQELRDRFAAQFNVPVQKPEGTYFFFFSIEPLLQGRDYWQIIDDLLDAGVSVAPGGDFGSNYQHYLRLCFTGEPPQRIEKAIERINGVLLKTDS
ncbi:MAG: pyridoxal phosphate-dependent aminotransferase [Calditrichia bacterium]